MVHGVRDPLAPLCPDPSALIAASAVRSFNKLFVPVFFYQTLNYVWMSENVAWWPSDATLANTPLALGTPAPPPNLCRSSSFC